ncbi:MAG: hypothetical protein IJW49_09900 [Clostridia bacterium]|nr:hypothetical protein [Clostridia bacterium]
MAKETLTHEGIKHDLKKIAEKQISNKADARMVVAIPITIIVIFAVFLTGFNWIVLLISALAFLIALYHYYRFFEDLKTYRYQKKRIMEAIDRSDYSISVQKLSHIATETVYEPFVHQIRMFGGVHAHSTKEIQMFHFVGGDSWRLPGNTNSYSFYKHYTWSREFYLSSEGLLNMSVAGNEFYFVTLQGEHEISYIYPCKIFTLDKSLM